MKVKIHFSFLLYLFLIGIIASWSTCFSALIALAVHELGHCIISKLLGEESECLDLTPFGGVMCRRSSKASLKGIRGMAIALAGPLANYVFIYVLALFSRAINAEILEKLIISNLAMMLINLLPALPLDGGQVVFSVGYYFCPINRLISVLTGMGQVIGSMLISAVLYAFLKQGTINCSLLIIGAYLIAHARSKQKQLRAENLYLILGEQLNQQTNEVRSLSFYSVPADMPLYAALSAINEHTDSMFIIQMKDEIQFIDGRKVCQAAMSNPNLLFEEIAVSITK